MRVVEILREEIQRRGIAYSVPICKRRMILAQAKRVARQRDNVRAFISRQLSKN